MLFQFIHIEREQADIRFMDSDFPFQSFYASCNALMRQHGMP